MFHDHAQPIEQLTELKHTKAGAGARIAVGADGSGTQPVALDVLRINGITHQHASLFELETQTALARFRKRELDVLLMVASPAADAVVALLRDANVRAMTFTRHHAYTKRLPHLQTVEVHQGLISRRRTCRAAT